MVKRDGVILEKVIETSLGSRSPVLVSMFRIG